MEVSVAVPNSSGGLNVKVTKDPLWLCRPDPQYKTLVVEEVSSLDLHSEYFGVCSNTVCVWTDPGTPDLIFRVSDEVFLLRSPVKTSPRRRGCGPPVVSQTFVRWVGLTSDPSSLPRRGPESGDTGAIRPPHSAAGRYYHFFRRGRDSGGGQWVRTLFHRLRLLGSGEWFPWGSGSGKTFRT